MTSSSKNVCHADAQLAARLPVPAFASKVPDFEEWHVARRLCCCSGLFLPTSDLDLVIINSGCRDVVGGLRALATGLTRKGMARSMQVTSRVLRRRSAESCLTLQCLQAH